MDRKLCHFKTLSRLEAAQYELKQVHMEEKSLNFTLKRVFGYVRYNSL